MSTVTYRSSIYKPTCAVRVRVKLEHRPPGQILFIYFIHLAFSLSGKGHCYRFPQLQLALCSGGGDSPQHRHLPTLIDKHVDSFKSPDRTSRD